LYHIHQLISDVLTERKIGCTVTVSRDGIPSTFEDGAGGWSLQTFHPQLAVQEDCMPRRAFDREDVDIYLKEIMGRNQRRWFKAWGF
jgi:hypothetical protein